MSELTRCYSCMAIMDGAALCPSCGWQSGCEQDNTLYLPQGYVLNNRYLMGKVIGVGGFGIVYVAWDTNLDLRVAVKEFLSKDYVSRSTDHVSLTPYTGSASEEHALGIEKFIDEAKALAKFQDHAGIVKVNESFRANNTAYMVMQYLDGMTLKEYLKRQPGEKMPFEMAVKAMIPIMDALREVHKAGFVHRDISPDNIFITQQRQIKLLDFGSARYAIGEHSKSLTSVLKHGYAPVEQYSSKGNQGPWSDVYAVAATIYRCVTGEAPPDAMERIQDDTIKAPGQFGIEIPPAGEIALMRGLALKASERFENVQLFQQALLTGDQSAPSASTPAAYTEVTTVIKSSNANAKPLITFKSINHLFYLVPILSGFFVLVTGSMLINTNSPVYGLVVLVFFALWGFSYIYHFVALYRCWAVLQGSTARTSPGKAVGYMFIPFYNIYWIFIAYRGLAEDANSFSETYGLKRKISVGLSTWSCISCILPYFNIIVAPILFPFLIFQWSKFYEEVSMSWNNLDVKAENGRKASSSGSIGLIIAAVVGGLFLLGIVAAIAIPQFSAYKAKAIKSAATSEKPKDQGSQGSESSQSSTDAADSKIIETLEKEAKAYNATLPEKVGDNVMMDKVTVGPGKRFTYFSTITNVTVDKLNIPVFKKAAKPELVKSWCGNPDIKNYFLQGVTIVASYSGSDTKHIVDIPVTRADCGY